MKYDHREISELSNDELIEACKRNLDALDKRDEAAKHQKFKNMPLPPVNPEFLKLIEALKAELESRGLSKK
jgi:hypothetical protein